MEGAAASMRKEGTSNAGIGDRPMDKRRSNPAEERAGEEGWYHYRLFAEKASFANRSKNHS
jgi:hypothetical protein